MPLSPMSGSFIFKTLLSSGCQHSMPANLQMNPSVLLLKSHEVKTFSESSIEALKALRQSISLCTALVKVIHKRMKTHVLIIAMLLCAIEALIVVVHIKLLNSGGVKIFKRKMALRMLMIRKKKKI